MGSQIPTLPCTQQIARGQKVKQGLEIENIPSIGKNHTKLILGSQGRKKSITFYSYDAPVSSYRAHSIDFIL